jgi:hypothetical protein
MAPVLKTGEVRASVGSNPTPSVSSINANPSCIKGFCSLLILDLQVAAQRSNLAEAWFLRSKAARLGDGCCSFDGH